MIITARSRGLANGFDEEEMKFFARAYFFPLGEYDKKIYARHWIFSVKVQLMYNLVFEFVIHNNVCDLSYFVNWI